MEKADTAGKSHLQKVLEAGDFSVTAEIGPPMSGDAQNIANKAKNMAGYIDAANVTDNQTAMVRMSSVAASCIALQNGMEPVVQMTCRDRNRIAIQSDLLGAYALGLRNVLVLGGDPPSVGNHPDAKPVFDLDTVSLLTALTRMVDENKFICGSELKAPVSFFLGATANPFAQPQDEQLAKMEAKINAGAHFIQTQAVYDVEKFSRWMEKVKEHGLNERAYILPGVIANRSLRSIEGTANVPGIEIPPPLIERMRRQGDDKDAQMAEGEAIAQEVITQLKDVSGISGVHIMAIGWESVVPRLVEKSGLLPRSVTEI